MVNRQLTVRQWVNREGVVEIASLLKTETASVRYWSHGKVLPTGKVMYKIRQLTKGEVSIDLSIDEHYSPKNETNRLHFKPPKSKLVRAKK